MTTALTELDIAIAEMRASLSALNVHITALVGEDTAAGDTVSARDQWTKLGALARPALSVSTRTVTVSGHQMRRTAVAHRARVRDRIAKADAAAQIKEALSR